MIEFVMKRGFGEQFFYVECRLGTKEFSQKSPGSRYV